MSTRISPSANPAGYAENWLLNPRLQFARYFRVLDYSTADSASSDSPREPSISKEAELEADFQAHWLLEPLLFLIKDNFVSDPRGCVRLAGQ